MTRQAFSWALNIVCGLIVGWVLIIVLTWPDTRPFVPWAVDGPIGIYLEDAYQTSQEILRKEEENRMAKEFFCAPRRNPFQQLVYRRETI